MVKDTYMVQTRSQSKAQANAHTVQSTKLVIQDTTPKVDKIPIKTEKDSKPLHNTVVNQQLPQGLVIPLGNIIPISTQPRHPQNLHVLLIKMQLLAQVQI